RASRPRGGRTRRRRPRARARPCAGPVAQTGPGSGPSGGGPGAATPSPGWRRRSRRHRRLVGQAALAVLDLALLAFLVHRQPAAVTVLALTGDARLERRDLRALRERVRAARPEVTALGGREQRRRGAGDGRQPRRAVAIQAGDRAQ